MQQLLAQMAGAAANVKNADDLLQPRPACSRNEAAAAADSSTSAAFCWVIWSSCATATFTWVMPSRCSLAAVVMSLMRGLTRRAPSTISLIVWPASATWAEPVCTVSTEEPISALISLAASAERPASARTSEATTAKPRPCSPARAASTAAFSARMLVWSRQGLQQGLHAQRDLICVKFIK